MDDSMLIPSKIKALALFLLTDQSGEANWISVDLGDNRAHIWHRDDAASLFDRLALELRTRGLEVRETERVRSFVPRRKKASGGKKASPGININLEDLL